jgi:APA family basic amino acid/polyamine antiporter
MAESRSPLVHAARTFSLPGVGLIVGIGAATAMLGVLLSQLLGISRVMLAMARRGDLPRALAHISPAHGVPDYGVLLCGLIVVLLSLFGTIQWIIAAATFTILLYYGITNLAALRLDPADKRFPDGVALLGLVSCLLLAVSLPPATIGFGLGLLLIGFALRGLFQRLARSISP